MELQKTSYHNIIVLQVIVMFNYYFVNNLYVVVKTFNNI